MPGFDGTGPMGMGPMTGGGMGFCAVPARDRKRPFGGRFFGRGRGRGWRNLYWATEMPGWMRVSYGYPAFGRGAYPYVPEMMPKEEMDMLKDQAKALKQQLDEIQGHISTLEKAQKEEEGE